MRPTVRPTIRAAVGLAAGSTIGLAVRAAVRIGSTAASYGVQLVVGQLDGACRVLGQLGLFFLAQVAPELRILPRTNYLV